MLKTYRNVILEEANYGGLPVAYYPLDEVAGTAAADQMTLARGTGYAGTYTGGYTLGALGPISGEASRGVTFNGSTGFVTVADASGLNLGTSDFSVEVWAKPRILNNPNSDSGAQSFADKYSAGANRGWNLGITSAGIVQFFCRGNSGVPSHNIATSSAIAVGVWTHVVGVRSGTTLTIYVNGTSTTNNFGGSTADVSTSGTSLLIGKISVNSATPVRWFDGIAARPAVYSYALSAARIQAHYLAGINGCNGLRI